MAEWTEIKIKINADDIDKASDIASMAVPYGIYIEDYRTLEEETLEIANIDIIDEDLLAKDRSVGYVHIYISPEENYNEAISFLRERFTAENIEHTIEHNACRNEDWENNWKEYFKPMKIGKRLLIRPLWIDDYDTEGRKVLSIEPGLAFGSGTHNTTRLCLQTLENYINGGEKVLDCGCGSGILSVASLLFGAGSAVGVDIDALAVKTAKENGETNGFREPQYSILQGNLVDKVTGKFDVVVANIVADIIILFAGQVGEFMNDGAVFITSGIIAPREEEVSAAFAANGFEIIERHEDGGWLCFVCKKK
ncbi:MAG: 50S ribosomal protein L11 methyltransferase [Oscillospiraceae bacterium]|nr:50S ribosomal protein L11 methyltransferase [Oscillospiraceae bacterium]